MTAEKQLKRVRAHTVYKTADGTRVPGVTTVLAVLNKPYLVAWANKLGLEGIDASEYRDAMAGIGRLTHERILAHFRGVEPDLSEYSPKEVELSDNAMVSFYNWLKRGKIEPFVIEEPIVSSEYRFGGTPDLYCLINGERVLVDFKTGKAIYDEHKIQLAAYSHLLETIGHPSPEARIVRIGRDEREDFEERIYTDLSLEWELFLHAKAIYDLKRRMSKA